MTRRQRTTKAVPAALQGYSENQRRFIRETFWPEAYAGPALVNLFAPEYAEDGTRTGYKRVSRFDIVRQAALYEAGVKWGNMVRRLAADGGRSVREVPPIAAYHTEPQSAADLFKASGNAFAHQCAKLAEGDGRPYRLFAAAARKAEAVLAGLDVEGAADVEAEGADVEPAEGLRAA